MISYKMKHILGMARGIVVVYENLVGLKEFLENKNIKVIAVPRNIEDTEIRDKLLFHRIFITNNSKDFIKDAIEKQYGIIATEYLDFKDSEHLSKIISDAIIDFDLWSMKAGFILELKSDNSHNLKILKG